MNATRLYLPLLLLALLTAGCARMPAPEPSPTSLPPTPTETLSPWATLVPGKTSLPSPVLRVSSDQGCTTVSVDLDTVERSSCASETADRWPLVEQRKAELLELRRTFASFEETGGESSLAFTGAGQTAPTPVEQRSIEAWARLALADAQVGQSSETAGLAIDWRMDGGDVAYFCGKAKVYVTGFAYASICSTEESARDVVRIRLSADEVAQVLAWSETYPDFGYWVTDDPRAQGAMTRGLTFSGHGSQQAGEDVKEAAMKIGSGVFYTMFNSRTANPQ
jgi:hypothetical protein